MSRKRKRTPWFWSMLFKLIVSSAAIGMIISYISIYINPSIVTFPLFFGLYFIPIALLNILILFIGIIKRSKSVWITFFILTPSLLFADRFVQWGEPITGDQGLSLKIATYNVGLFVQGKDSKEINRKEIFEFLKKESADIIALQEFYISDTNSIRRLLPSHKYVTYFLFPTKKGGYFGNITYSKFPIINKGKITFDSSTNLCIYSDINFHNRPIRVYNTHLESHSISFTTLIKRLRESTSITDQIIDVHDRVAETFKRRGLQVDKIVKHSQSANIPTIICGDLNDTPMSYTYNSLSENHKDSFRQSGKGFSATYSFLWPMLRIDYILHPLPIWCKSHKTPRIDHSDHYPVLTELIIP